MKVNHCMVFLMLLLCFLFYIDAGAQNIRGDTIFVDVNRVVAIVFPSSPSKAQLIPIDGQDSLYEARDMGKKTISVMAFKKGAKDQALDVAEGRRKHLLILSYKEGSPARTIDWSTVRKLSARVDELKKVVAKLLDEANSLYDQAKNNIPDEASWNAVIAKYKRLADLVEPDDLSVVKSRLEESRQKLQGIKESKYVEALKEGQNYYSLKKYSDARKAYLKASEEKPGDSQTLKYISLTDSVWAKDYVDKGDEANKVKNYVLAKTNYQQAKNIKPSYPFLQNKLKQATEDAAPQIYEIERKKGDQAMKAYDIEEARRAYDSALSVRPDDRYIKSQVKKLIIEEQKIEQEEKKEADYQSVLASAKGLADKATTRQEYELAIKEYNRASKMIPSRKFPLKKMNELTKIKNSIGSK